jgi:hypothetical protein
MPDLYSDTALSGNTRKTVDSSKFGTRELSFHQVEMGVDVQTNYTDSNSLFFKAVRALQEQVEIYTVGTPSGNDFTVVIAADTCPFPANRSNGDGNSNSRLEGIIDAACGTSCTVWNSKLRGGYLDNDC